MALGKVSVYVYITLARKRNMKLKKNTLISDQKNNHKALWKNVISDQTPKSDGFSLSDRVDSTTTRCERSTRRNEAPIIEKVFLPYFI